MKVLLTGAAGFVGSHVVRHLLMNTDWEIVAPVSFHHKGMAARIESSVCDLDGGAERVDIVHWDMRSPADGQQMARFSDCNAIWNVASESHVDRSIQAPGWFIHNNVALMTNVLDVARRIEPDVFLQMSTDEVYGPAYGDYRHKEWDVIAPSNPYSASKAAQEAICFSYWRTYDLPMIVTNGMNLFGEMQDPEKFLPMVIRNLRDGRPITVHADEEGRSGSRFYLHARNLADAWLFLTDAVMDPYTDLNVAVHDNHMRETLHYSGGGHRPPRFHVVGEREVLNSELVWKVQEIMGAKAAELEFVSFHSSRPGHDLRYALDGSKIAALGWSPPVPFDKSLETTVRWTLDHPEWLNL